MVTTYDVISNRLGGDEWSLRAFASMPSTAIFLRARAEIKNLLCELASNAKIWEPEQASTRLNFASKSSKGKILRAVKNFNGPFIAPQVVKPFLSENACSLNFFQQ